jgi:hypothetical protein
MAGFGEGRYRRPHRYPHSIAQKVIEWGTPELRAPSAQSNECFGWKQTPKNPRSGALLLFACVLAGCHRTTEFESFYPSLTDAVKDRAFERRWLPSFLPANSRNIHVAGDLSPSRVWCAFEFILADSDQLRKSLKPVDTLPASLANVPGPGKSWWPSFLEGNLDPKRIHDAGLQLYVVEEPATASTTTLELLVIDWAKGRAFLYGPPA